MRSLVVTALLLAGCAANPADNKPMATVQTPTASVSATPGELQGTLYAIRPDSSKVAFVGSKVTGSHDGGFKDFDGKIGVVDNDPEKSAVQIDIKADTIWADDDRLTKHLKSKDFFEVEQYPQAGFRSTSIKKDGDHYTITGDLTMHGQTRTISFPATISITPEAVNANAEFSINRFDFGIMYKGKADNLIRKEVLIKLDLNAPKV